MNYSFTQIDMTKSETQYYASTHPYVEVHLKFPNRDAAYLNHARSSHILRTVEHILKLQKSKLVRIKYPIQLTNFELDFSKPVKLNSLWFYSNIAHFRPHQSQIKNKIIYMF